MLTHWEENYVTTSKIYFTFVQFIVGFGIEKILTMRNIELSIIVPLFNEEDSVALLFKQIKEASLQTKKEYEIIFVDDGSSDCTVRKRQIRQRQQADGGEDGEQEVERDRVERRRGSVR